MLNELENKREMAEGLFNAFIHIMADSAIDTAQMIELDKCKWYFLGYFDAFISFEKNKHFVEV